MPQVSVVLPTRDRASVLGRALRSALAQTVRDLEVLVVDDGSRDHTSQVIDELSDPRLRLLRHAEPQGAPAARNLGLDAARGAYLALLDSDDEWLPCKLERQLEALRSATGGTDAVTCGYTWVGRRVCTSVVAVDEEVSYEGLLALSAGPWSGPTILVRSGSAAGRVRFDEAMPSAQDWDYLVRVARVARVVTVREPLVRVFTTEGQHISSLRGKIHGGLRVLDKYADELGSRPAALRQHLARLASLSLRAGDRSTSLQVLERAARLAPFEARWWVLYAAVRALPVPVALRWLALTRSTYLRKSFRPATSER